LKPARGRISAAPERGEAPLDVDGMLTRTVADTAALLDVLAGYEPGDVAWAPPPAEPFAAAAMREPSRLRIAVTTKPPLADAAIDPQCMRAVADAAGLLRSLGHDVQEIDPPWQIEGLSELFGGVFSIHIATQIVYSGMVAGREPTAEDMEPMSWAIHQMTKQIDSVHGVMMEMQLQALTRQLVEFLSPYDALLTPALAERPLPLGTLDTAAPDPMSTFTRSGYFTPFTPIFNASGQPAISLPLYQGEDGLPLAVQLAGRPAEEATLLSLARQLEIAVPWAARRPPVS
ncbi:MAG TPA: amidase family protein, partial [Solirubrobacteraceae bacterium]|nr:amidase family protein [Solirubrobacteraceae bacterium]